MTPNETTITALHTAAEAGDTARCMALLDGDTASDVNGLDEQRVTPLYYAAQEGHVAVCILLLSHGAAVDGISTVVIEEESYELTALFAAAEKGHTETSTILLDAGAAVDHAEPLRGYTPLLWAAEEGHVAASSLLLMRGAKVNHARGEEESHCTSACGGGRSCGVVYCSHPAQRFGEPC